MQFINIYKQIKNNLIINCNNYNVYTKNGKIKNNFLVLIIYSVIDKYGICIKPQVTTKLDYENKIKEYNKHNLIKFITIYSFKSKNEVETLTDQRYNEIIGILQKQYKDYLVNESLQNIQQDFD